MKRVTAIGPVRRVLLCCPLAVAVTLVSPHSVWAEEGASAPTWSPAAYEHLALENHPSLRASHHAWQASVREGEAARSRLAQPVLSYRAEIGTPWTDNPGLGHMVMLSQMIMWPSVLDAMAEPARVAAAVERERFDAQTLAIVFDVRRALIEIARVDHHKELIEEQRQYFQDAIGIVEAGMATGRAGYVDALRLTLSSEMLAERLDMLGREREESLIELRALLGLAAASPLGFDFHGDHDPTAVEEQPLEAAPLVAAMLAHHPELRQMAREAEMARAMGLASARSRRPSPMIGLGYSNMPAMAAGERQDALLIELSVPIPLFGRQYDADVERFESTRAAALEQRTALQRTLTAGIEASVARIDERLRRLQRYRIDLLPIATDVSERLLAEIELGRAMITDFQMAQQQQLDLAMMLVDLRADIAIERARLTMLTGGHFKAHGAHGAPSITIEEIGGRP
ncbi:MAG: TolC family protein [Bradymonadaceae bacterium]|nr:TolC family protein [Lujinxingiaceae bacterium]